MEDINLVVNITLFDFIYGIGASLYLISKLPQIFKNYKTKSTKDLSISMFLLICIADSSAIIAGMLIKSWSMIYMNIFAMTLTAILLIQKLIYDKKNIQ
jgi:MtN3 and saliva related transmembrane protein